MPLWRRTSATRQRQSGRVLVAGISLAVFPLAVAADHTLLLEPYLVSFCLLGVIALFRGGELASPRRVLLAGLAFGFAGSIKLWAVLPAIAALICCVPAWRRQFGLLLIGLALGFVAACVVFFAFAPHAFIHDVFSAQIHRGTSGRGCTHRQPQRLVMISGISGLPGLNRDNRSRGRAVCGSRGLDSVRLCDDMAPSTQDRLVHPSERCDRGPRDVRLTRVLRSLRLLSSGLPGDAPRRNLHSSSAAWGRHLLFDRAGSRRRPLAALAAIVVLVLLGAAVVLLVQQDTRYRGLVFVRRK